MDGLHMLQPITTVWQCNTSPQLSFCRGESMRHIDLDKQTFVFVQTENLPLRTDHLYALHHVPSCCFISVKSWRPALSYSPFRSLCCVVLMLCSFLKWYCAAWFVAMLFWRRVVWMPTALHIMFCGVLFRWVLFSRVPYQLQLYDGACKRVLVDWDHITWTIRK